MIQYWLVGANWAGDDQAQTFYGCGFWELGWDDNDQPSMAALRNSMRIDDRVAVKQMRGKGAQTINIRALGIVTRNDETRRQVFIKWVVTGLNREVAARGCFASIHGPYTITNPVHAPWLKEVFLL